LKRDCYFQIVTRKSNNFEKSNEKHVEAQKKESKIVNQELSKKIFYEQDKRVIFILKISFLRLELKSQILQKTSLA